MRRTIRPLTASGRLARKWPKVLRLVTARIVAIGPSMSGILFTLAAAVSAKALLPLPVDSPSRPFPQHVSYAPGSIKPNALSQSILDEDVRKFYVWWKDHYLIQDRRLEGKPTYRVSFGKRKSERTVSEGQGYGMIITALMAGHDPEAHQIFDGLLAFAVANHSENSKALMAWKIPYDQGDGDSAFDGDADIAYALMLADVQWGNKGPVAYRTYAKQRLTAIKRWTISSQTSLPLLGDWVRSNDDNIDETMGRTSDFMPAHFASFARYTKNPTWSLIATRTRATISSMQAKLSPETGLLPDFAIHLDQSPEAAAPGFLEGEYDGTYFTNAARAPLRIGLDALINGNPDSVAQARRISSWIERETTGDPQAIHAGYTLDGTKLEKGDYYSSLYGGPFGVAAMTNPNQQAWLNAVYEAVRKHHEDYYEDSVALLSLLVMTGNYWDPTR